MIDTLHALPGLSRNCLADIEQADPELFRQLAPSLVIENGSGAAIAGAIPAGLGQAARIDAAAYLSPDGGQDA